MKTQESRVSVEEKPLGKHRTGTGCFVRGVIGLTIFLAIILVTGLIYQTAASASDARQYQPSGMLNDVGSYRLHLYCTGDASTNVITGDASPTVIRKQDRDSRD